MQLSLSFSQSELGMWKFTANGDNLWDEHVYCLWAASCYIYTHSVAVRIVEETRHEYAFIHSFNPFLSSSLNRACVY
jgi:hypothetical protein